MESKYCYSMNEEEFEGEEDTREEAFEIAKDLYENDLPSHIHVGKIVPVTIRELMPKFDYFLSKLEDSAYDIVMEHRKHYFKGIDSNGNPTNTTADVIEKEIVEVFIKYGIEPLFHRVTNVTEHATNYEEGV